MKQYLASGPVPAFGIGEFEAPMKYLETALPAFGKRLGISEDDLQRFVEAGLASANACLPLLSQEALMQGKVDPIPEARAFWNLVGDTALSQDSMIVNFGNLRTALRYQMEGCNVAIVQNHRSGSDMLLMETLIRRYLGSDVCDDWAYMAGHAVNLFLIPLIFSAGLRRFQIFSVKYQSNGIPGMNAGTMKEQNQRALRALNDHTSEGGKVLVYYPEGGRGDGCMKEGEARTSCLLRNMALSGKPLIVLPTFVGGTDRLLPPVRSENEFNEILEHMWPGTADFAVGEPINWEELVQANKSYEGNRFEWNKRICDTLLGLVAGLGPVEESGCYNPNNPYIQGLVAPFTPSGATL